MALPSISKNVNGAGSDVDFDLVKTTEKHVFEFNKELPILWGIIYVHNVAEQLILITCALMNPDTADEVWLEAKTAELAD